MSRQDKEPTGLTLLKAAAALCLILLALVFGAGGACGVLSAAQGIWSTISERRGGPHNDYAGVAVEIGAVCAVVGLAAALVLGWAAVAMLRKKGNRDE
jgi:O-antigen ligase